MALLDLFRTAALPKATPVTGIPVGTSHLARTQGGAHVAVHPQVRAGADDQQVEGTAWTCLGCDTVGNGNGPAHPPAWPSPVRQDTITAANTHAAACHFGPKPA